MRVRLLPWFALGVVALRFVPATSAQFTPTFLQNKSYWGDGKSELDLYNAEFIRDGQPRQCELLMVFAPVFVDPKNFSYIDAVNEAQTLPAIRMNQLATIPRGLISEQRSLDAVWRMDFMSLARLSFAGNDGIGNISKDVSENRENNTLTWIYSSDGYRGKVERQSIALGPKPVLAYDELPLRIRTIDFSKPNGEVEVQLLPTLATSQKELGELKPAKISWKVQERTIDIDVQHAGGKDHFVLDSNFPFLLREWRAADGTQFKMKNSLKVDYRNYLRNGDRERALKDPMLRHPD